MPLILTELFFLPPMAIARVGASPIPLESFAWEEDQDRYGGCRTVIRPRVTFEVLADGTLRPYLPESISFKDVDGIRPVAPFLELWAEVRGPDGARRQVPMTLALLAQLGSDLSSLRFRIRAGNFKASRRTHNPACAFFADAMIPGGDYRPYDLAASSPCLPGHEPLVYRDKPIWLGRVQVIRPSPGEVMGQNLEMLRLRFTPGVGAVYGPTAVADGACSPLEPGRLLAYESMAARIHQVVEPKNRILNSNTPWSGYVMDTGRCDDPQPADSYDGANVGRSESWGIVDDTCEAVIKAELVLRGQRYTASARVLVGQPDYAPDRRHFFSLADELADRELPVLPLTEDTLDLTVAEMADLFARIFETASLMNLDAARDYLVRENLKRVNGQAWPGIPQIGLDGMMAADRPVSRFTPTVLEQGPRDRKIPLSDIARQVHAGLIHPDHLLQVLRTQRAQIERLVRPPFGRFSQLPETPAAPGSGFRDPRVFRDTLHDMRMPPYMRDSGREPLSITSRQYKTLMALLHYLTTTGEDRRQHLI